MLPHKMQTTMASEAAAINGLPTQQQLPNDTAVVSSAFNNEIHGDNNDVTGIASDTVADKSNPPTDDALVEPKVEEAPKMEQPKVVVVMPMYQPRLIPKTTLPPPPKVEQPPPPQAAAVVPPPAAVAVASTGPTNEEDVRRNVRTLQGLLLKHRGGPGFGAGRLKAPEAK